MAGLNDISPSLLEQLWAGAKDSYATGIDRVRSDLDGYRDGQYTQQAWNAARAVKMRAQVDEAMGISDAVRGPATSQSLFNPMPLVQQRQPEFENPYSHIPGVIFSGKNILIPVGK